MILFLDFDGVLHPEPCYDETLLFCHRERLEEVLRDFPDIDVVVSSMWRHERSMEELRGLFSPDIGQRIIDVTPHWSTAEQLFDVIGRFERHVEIEAWRRNTGRLHEHWIALDDKPYWFRPFLKNLIVCDSATGFDADAEHRLRAKIKGASRACGASLKRFR